MPTPFDPITLGVLELPNRLAMAPIKTAFGTTAGQVTPQLVGYFRRRARGGVGLLISEPLYVDKRGQEHPKQLGIDADDKLEGLRLLVEAVHEEGATIFAHLNHGGRAANPKAAGGPPEAPSRVPCPRTGCEPQALGQERIAAIVEGFARAALRAREVGFDGVELQFGLGYLVGQFLSPATNRRSDAYGTDRSRFAREVFAAVRGAVGNPFPVGCRISASEKAPGGLEIEDAKSLARQLQSWGANLIHVATGSNCESLPWYFQHMALPGGVNEALAAQVREAVDLPVMAAGRLGDPARIRQVIASESVDMVALGRPLLADPDLPAKMARGADDEVMLCGHCLQGCFNNVRTGKGIGCNINPEVGRELEEVAPAARPRRVAVVGGGPAGMQAALTARRRGHQVTLYEERDRLGGQFVLAARAPGKQRIEQPLRSLVASVERSDVEIRLNEEVTRERMQALGFDAVIVATGSRPIIPEIAGLADPMTGEEVLSGERETGGRVLVLGGGMVGMEVAEHLALRGKHCVVVEALEEIAQDMDPVTRKLMLRRLESLPVTVRTKTTLVRYEDGRAVIRHEGEEQELDRFDSVVVAIGNRAYDQLSGDLRTAGITVQLAGDAARPANILEAVTSGHRAAMEI